MSKNTEIAQTILEQIGGKRFLSMTGAKNIMAIDGGLSFRLPKFSGIKCNYVKIILNSSDLYDVELGRICGNTYKVIKQINDIFCEKLERTFSEETGLATKLF